ncbi:hypothetical protein J6590_006737 [Homalodisca vitripennis]|nr:hypothetical protein J6590_006737 [Homalodisca vitripennis]
MYNNSGLASDFHKQAQECVCNYYGGYSRPALENTVVFTAAATDKGQLKVAPSPQQTVIVGSIPLLRDRDTVGSTPLAVRDRDRLDQ